MASVTASIGIQLQDRRVRRRLEGDGIRGLVVSRYHDATSIKVQIAALQDVLLPCARYAHKDNDGSWRLLPWSEFRHYTKTAPRNGVVELFAIHYSAAWEDTEGRRYKHKLMAPPMLLQAGNASNIHSALDVAVPALSINSLKEIADKNGGILIHETPDNIAYSKRHMG